MHDVSNVTDRAEGRLLLGTFPLTASSWYAVRVRSRAEKTVQAALQARHIDEFLPTYHQEVRWSDRTKTVERALFPGYLFCRAARKLDLIPVVQLAGVVQILGTAADGPLPIPDEQIDAVRRVCASANAVVPCAYVVGTPVLIASGPLAGVSGIVRRTKGALQVVVSIEVLGRAVAVEIESRDLTAEN